MRWARRFTVAAPRPTRADDRSKAGTILTEDNEVRLGRENAEENDKHVKLVTDAALVERVNRIGQELIWNLKGTR